MAGAEYEKRRGETDLQWRSRCARLDAEARDRMQPLVRDHAIVTVLVADDYRATVRRMGKGRFG